MTTQPKLNQTVEEYEASRVLVEETRCEGKLKPHAEEARTRVADSSNTFLVFGFWLAHVGRPTLNFFK